MLQEVIDLQQSAIKKLFNLALGGKKEITFRAPTGSGKTRMMADFMNRVLAAREDYIFIVSSLSKGELAKQNYETFVDCSENGTFPHISPYLINTELSSEEGLFIPEGHNVYVLPRDLYKKGSKLSQGPWINFIDIMTDELYGKGKKIILIKDECHQATNKLDELSKYFEKTINFSATPKLKRGQKIDVEITDEEAENACLIKEVVYGDDNDTVEDAIVKFEQIKKEYVSLGVNPCLIIQISNKEKADEEWANIKNVLDKVQHQGLKWMVIVNKQKKNKTTLECDTNDSVKKRLKMHRWKDYAKGSGSTIDVIIFKLAISEGWDIPRACMLYQVRDTQSKQLDEQVIGRVRRNPRLVDFETLSEEQKKLAMTAWVWGIKPKEEVLKKKSISLKDNGVSIRPNIIVSTTRLKPMSEKVTFDVNSFLESSQLKVSHDSIFSLYCELMKSENAIVDECYKYASNDVSSWLKYIENLKTIKQKHNDYICNYDESMTIGEEKSFPIDSLFLQTDHVCDIEDWVWCRKDNNTTFSFDSEAERKWAALLNDITRKEGGFVNIDGEEVYLWGKNFPYHSEIKFEYYANGTHSSYPDFIMKDKKGRIHIFEVKSVNVSSDCRIDRDEYENKIRNLSECYRACSKKLDNHLFYLPIMNDNDWDIRRFENGEERTLTKSMFKDSLK